MCSASFTLATVHRHVSCSCLCAQGCVRLRLDSGMQRLDAHRFYEANGMQKAGYHFNCQLDT
jgi:hypothetical protein